MTDGAPPGRVRKTWSHWHRTTRIAVVVASLWALWTIFQALILGLFGLGIYDAISPAQPLSARRQADNR